MTSAAVTALSFLFATVCGVAAAAEQPFATRTVLSADGTRIAYDITGSGPPIVLSQMVYIGIPFGPAADPMFRSLDFTHAR